MCVLGRLRCPLPPGDESLEIPFYFLSPFIRWHCIRRATEDTGLPFGTPRSRSLGVQKPSLSFPAFIEVTPDLTRAGGERLANIFKFLFTEATCCWRAARHAASGRARTGAGFTFASFCLSAWETAEPHQIWGWKVKPREPREQREALGSIVRGSPGVQKGTGPSGAASAAVSAFYSVGTKLVLLQQP